MRILLAGGSGAIARQLNDNRPQRGRNVFEKPADRTGLAGEHRSDERTFEVAAKRRPNLRFRRDRPFSHSIGTVGSVVWLGLFLNQWIQDRQAARPHGFSPDKQSTHDS